MRISVDERLVKSMVEAEGLELVELRISRKHSLKAKVRRPEGGLAIIVFPSTPSDWRWSLNKRAELRRFARTGVDVGGVRR